MLQIPPDRLAADVLDALIEEFVTRHGTDLTDSLTKSEQVRRQLLRGEIIIAYDEETETANIVAKDAKEPPREAPAAVRKNRPQAEDGPKIIYDEPEPPGDVEY